MKSAAKAPAAVPEYVVVTGMNYGADEKRLEPGDRVPADLPSTSIPWLLEQGHIAPAAPEVEG